MIRDDGFAALSWLSRARLGTLAASCLVLLLAGCTVDKHGAFTEETAEHAVAKRKEMDAASAYDTARQRYVAGNLDEAYRYINQALALDNTVVDVLLLRTQILADLGNDEEALLASVAEGLAVAPADARFNYFLGVYYERQGESNKAKINYRKAAMLDPGSVQYKLAAAEMMIEQLSFAEADVYLKEAVRLHPNAAGLLQTQGFLAQIQGRPRQALIHFADALSLAPDQAVLRENLAVAHCAVGEYAKALVYFESLAPETGFDARLDVQVMMAKCYLACNQPVDARRILRRLLRTQAKGLYPAWKMMAETAVMLNDLPLLREAASKMIAMQPDSEDGYLALSLYHRQQDEREAAARVLDRYAQTSPARFSPLFVEYRNSLRE